jgi:hypothetical protein
MRIIAAFAATLLLVSVVSAQNLSALMNEALDKQVGKLELSGSLPKAMQDIADKTGVRIEAQRAVWDLLPWGEQTNLTARIENQTLRQALTGITQKLGLTFELKDQYVELQPMPALRRLGRRATVTELKALDVLVSTEAQFGTDKRVTVKEVVAAVDSRLQGLDSELTAAKKPPLGLAVEYRVADNVLQEQTVFISRGASLAEALETLNTTTRATWYPWGKSIVILPKEEAIRNQLSKTLTMRYNGTDISQVLSELSLAAGVEFSVQPGAVQQIPPDFRKINLLLDNASVRQALENISGFTGLGYVVNEKGVYLWNQTADRPVTGGSDPIIGQVELQGLNVYLRTSQVPPDVRDYIKYKAQQHVEQLRAKMKEEGFKPSTQPATTQPAGVL